MNVAKKDFPDATKRTRIIVTGLSGAGRASSMHILEDEGFELIDNPPFNLLEAVLKGPQESLVVGVDTRTNGFSADKFATLIKRLREEDNGLDIKILYLFADTDCLLGRFTKTRRKHPLASVNESSSVRSAIEHEGILLVPVHEIANITLDTSRLSLAELRGHLVNHFCLTPKRVRLSLMSFAYPAGVPREADLVFDARFLRNPYYDKKLQALTGLDPKVREFVFEDSSFEEFIGSIERFVKFMLPKIEREGKKYFVVAIGCSGGRHRSVSSIEELAKRCKENKLDVDILVAHRELNVG